MIYVENLNINNLIMVSTDPAMMSNEELLAQLSDEDDMNNDSNFQFAIVGDNNCTQVKD